MLWKEIFLGSEESFLEWMYFRKVVVSMGCE